MNNLLAHPNTSDALASFLESPSHALLVTGTKGVVSELSNILLSKLLGIAGHDKLKRSSKILRITPNKSGNISINDIRDAWVFAKTSAGSTNISRAILIEESSSMTREAQNSLLKLLEEPPADLLLVLLAPNRNSLLPTIASRAQHIDVKPLAQQQIIKILSKRLRIEENDARARLLISNWDIYSAIDNSQAADSMTSFSTTKGLLALRPFERAAAFQSYAVDREKAKVLVQDIYQISHLALRSSVTAGRGSKRGKVWLKRLALAERTLSNLESNGNIKLNLTTLALGF